MGTVLNIEFSIKIKSEIQYLEPFLFTLKSSLTLLEKYGNIIHDYKRLESKEK